MRKPYHDIKNEVLETYFDFCRDRGWGLGMSHEQILGSTSYEYENVFNTRIEKLMLCVVQLVLSGSWYKDAESSARQWVMELFETESIDELIQDLPANEKDEFLNDMRALNLI